MHHEYGRLTLATAGLLLHDKVVADRYKSNMDLS